MYTSKDKLLTNTKEKLLSKFNPRQRKEKPKNKIIYTNTCVIKIINNFFNNDIIKLLSTIKSRIYKSNF